MQTFGPGDSKL